MQAADEDEGGKEQLGGVALRDQAEPWACEPFFLTLGLSNETRLKSIL